MSDKETSDNVVTESNAMSEKKEEQQPNNELLEKQEWSRKMRMLFSPPDMLDDDGQICQQYFRPSRQLFNTQAIMSLKWSETQDLALLSGILEHGVHDWPSIVLEHLPNWDAQALCDRASILLIGPDAKSQDLLDKYDADWRPSNFSFFGTLETVTNHVLPASLHKHEKELKEQGTSVKSSKGKPKPSYYSSGSDRKKKPKSATKPAKKLTKKKITPKKKSGGKKEKDSGDEEESENASEEKTNDEDEEDPSSDPVFIPRERSARASKTRASYQEDNYDSEEESN
ncbi:hypothetical protein AKO1_013333 [Acrasis kona]|uniref:Uncharacterized protein n=1 Tax=Acrasis kona TaxID=1008807 RepID=A0AAW2YZN3_9EUKA